MPIQWGFWNISAEGKLCTFLEKKIIVFSDLLWRSINKLYFCRKEKKNVTYSIWVKMLLSFCLPVYQCVCLSVCLSFFPYSHLFLRQRQRCSLKENRLYISYWLAYRKLTSEIWAISQVVSGLSVTAHAYHTRFQEIHLRTQLPFANDDVTFQIDFKLELGYYSGHKVRVCVEEKRYGAHEVSAVVIDNWLPKEKSVKRLGKHDDVKRTCKRKIVKGTTTNRSNRPKWNF